MFISQALKSNLRALSSFSKRKFIFPITTSQRFSSSVKFDLHDVKFEEGVLPYQEDRYEGVVIPEQHLPLDPNVFIEKLRHSMEIWKEKQKRGIWLRIPIEKSSFIPLAVYQGFTFHHAEKDYLMMTAWICNENENRIPPNASHQVGVGCVVIKDGKLLLVQEKNGPLKGSGVWKLPTGLVEAGEDIPEAAEREVLEETGISTKFVRLLAFRQAHRVLFDKSDLFFVCILTPINDDISVQESEIAACEWKSPFDYFEQHLFKSSPLHSLLNELILKEITKLSSRNSNTLNTSIVSTKLPSGIRTGDHTLFYVEEP